MGREEEGEGRREIWEFLERSQWGLNLWWDTQVFEFLINLTVKSKIRKQYVPSDFWELPLKAEFLLGASSHLLSLFIYHSFTTLL